MSLRLSAGQAGVRPAAALKARHRDQKLEMEIDTAMRLNDALFENPGQAELAIMTFSCASVDRLIDPK